MNFKNRFPPNGDPFSEFSIILNVKIRSAVSMNAMEPGIMQLKVREKIRQVYHGSCRRFNSALCVQTPKIPQTDSLAAVLS